MLCFIPAGGSLSWCFSPLQRRRPCDRTVGGQGYRGGHYILKARPMGRSGLWIFYGKYALHFTSIPRLFIGRYQCWDKRQVVYCVSAADQEINRARYQTRLWELGDMRPVSEVRMAQMVWSGTGKCQKERKGLIIRKRTFCGFLVHRYIEKGNSTREVRISF